jgi:hypothetical protein
MNPSTSPSTTPSTVSEAASGQGSGRVSRINTKNKKLVRIRAIRGREEKSVRICVIRGREKLSENSCNSWQRRNIYERTLVKRGATIGANATIVCPVTIGRYAFIGAGAVVVSNVPDYALMLGVPARQRGWMSRHGHRLHNPNDDDIMVCRESGWRYKEAEPGVLRCLDWPEDEALPMTND